MRKLQVKLSNIGHLKVFSFTWDFFQSVVIVDGSGGGSGGMSMYIIELKPRSSYIQQLYHKILSLILKLIILRLVLIMLYRIALSSLCSLGKT